jgi:hypothetical protein
MILVSQYKNIKIARLTRFAKKFASVTVTYHPSFHRQIPPKVFGDSGSLKKVLLTVFAEISNKFLLIDT